MEYFLNFDKMAYVQGLKPEGCILCELAKRKNPEIDLAVFEDDLFTVCVNLYPYNPGHLMIYPRRHIEDIRSFTREESDRCAVLTRLFLDILDETHHPSAYNIGYNMGPNAGASIRHLHMHVIPRYPHELGIADLIAGKRVLVESPMKTAEKIRHAVEKNPDLTNPASADFPS